MLVRRRAVAVMHGAAQHVAGEGAARGVAAVLAAARQRLGPLGGGRLRGLLLEALGVPPLKLPLLLLPVTRRVGGVRGRAGFGLQLQFLGFRLAGVFLALGIV